MITNLFNSATNGSQPHPWQRKLADEGQLQNRLIRIPTGMGKTLGVLTTWLLHRVVGSDRDWPTRLVWCLPMRTLVEQTESESRKLLAELKLDDRVDVHLLMGGVAAKRWYDEPEMPAILIGTQDMLLSRALNRGYAMGRAAWPRAFGLLNTDALWVMDEVQLMGVGLATSAQLQAFSVQDRAGKETVKKPRCTWWMSATLQPQWLESPETEALLPELTKGILTVDSEDRNGPQWESTKPVERVAKELAAWPDLIVDRHQSHSPDPKTGRQTLVVVNTVKQARELYSKVAKHVAKETPETLLHLIHSRFRPADRESWIGEFLSRETLGPDVNRILIATQVVEAGVDISASCLITELAPWPSLVQRFGRAARYGGTAEIVVLDQEHTDDKKALPYAMADLDAARNAVDRNHDVSIGHLEDFEANLGESEIAQLYPYNPLHVLLRDEFEELFDTSPDLSGADMDISRFVREGDETRDLQVFWRNWQGDRPAPLLQPDRRELCAVPIGEAKAWIKKVQGRKEPVWFWDYLQGEWLKVDADKLRPGLIILVGPTSGGYDAKTGFTGDKPKKNEAVAEIERTTEVATYELADESDENEQGSSVDVWKTIATHCREAEQLANAVAKDLGLPSRFTGLTALALRLHDWGKAHTAFASGTYRVTPERTDLAKAPDAAWRPRNRLYDTPSHGPRRGFRHELASCLAVLELLRGANPDHPAILGKYHEMLIACGIDAELKASGWEEHPIAAELNQLSEVDFNLLLYLIVSHHGKVRVSLQASPKDQEFPFDDDRFVGTGMPIRGVREEDDVPSELLPARNGEVEMPNLTLSLAPAAMGLSSRYGASWSERVHSLMSVFGPFTLGYLEAIVRTVDGRASDDSQSPGRDPDRLLGDVDLSIDYEASERESAVAATERETEVEHA
ncbi:MAG: CRISPR-associated helicase Cas3' [Planctomycetes bacterium]|nr:CRISPR-associated helicase Cas3' [Planctomycetota bacterium]